MNWEVIFLDGKEGRPYRECKVCRALKDKGLIEEVEPVAVFVPVSEKGKVLDILKRIPPDSLEAKLKELYESWGVDNFERKIDEEDEELIILSFGSFKINTCETCIFHCEKRNKVWRENNKWDSNILSIFQSRVDEKVAEAKCVFDFSVFPDVSFIDKVFPEEARFFFSEFLGESNFIGAKLKNADFRGAKFKSARFWGAELESADFWEAKFESADFIGAKFENADFWGAEFESARFWEAKFESVNFREAKFESAVFWEVEFKSADFTKAEFESADFWEAKFESANFGEVKFESAVFWKWNLKILLN